LLRREQRPDLSGRAFQKRVHFLHRFLMNGLHLRFGLIDDRLDLGLLIGRQIQSVGQVFERKSASSMPVPMTPAAMAGTCLDQSKAAEDDGNGGDKCKDVSFHSFDLLVFSH
jgi:hypothetical protein